MNFQEINRSLYVPTTGETLDLSDQDVFSIACWLSSNKHTKIKGYPAAHQVYAAWEHLLADDKNIIRILCGILGEGYSIEDVKTDFVWYSNSKIQTYEN